MLWMEWKPLEKNEWTNENRRDLLKKKKKTWIQKILELYLFSLIF